MMHVCLNDHAIDSVGFFVLFKGCMCNHFMFLSCLCRLISALGGTGQRHVFELVTIFLPDFLYRLLWF